MPQCVNPGGCLYPVPDDIGAEGELVLWLFLRLQTQWIRAGMDGRRTGIPRDCIAIEADACGIDLSEHRLDKFRACESAVIAYDIDCLNSKS